MRGVRLADFSLDFLKISFHLKSVDLKSCDEMLESMFMQRKLQGFARDSVVVIELEHLQQQYCWEIKAFQCPMQKVTIFFPSFDKPQCNINMHCTHSFIIQNVIKSLYCVHPGYCTELTLVECTSHVRGLIQTHTIALISIFNRIIRRILRLYIHKHHQSRGYG